jgi:hypothetical protein
MQKVTELSYLSLYPPQQPPPAGTAAMLRWAAKGVVSKCGSLPATASVLESFCSASSCPNNSANFAKYQNLLANGEPACVAQPSLRTVWTSSSGAQPGGSRGLLQVDMQRKSLQIHMQALLVSGFMSLLLPCVGFHLLCDSSTGINWDTTCGSSRFATTSITSDNRYS